MSAKKRVKWNLLCDLGFTDYLIASAVNQQVVAKSKTYEVSLDDQLTYHNCFLQKYQRRYSDTYGTFAENKIGSLLFGLYRTLENIFRNVTLVLELYRNRQGDIDCNRVYLRNILPLSKQVDYNEITTAIRRSTDLLSSFDSMISKELSSIIINCTEGFINLQHDISKKQDILESLRADLMLCIFKIASDILCN